MSNLTNPHTTSVTPFAITVFAAPVVMILNARRAAAAAVYSALLCVKRGVNHWPARALWPRMQQPLLATAAARQTSRIAAMNPHMPFLPFFVATLALDFEER